MYLKTIRNVVKNCGFQRKIQLQILTAERHQQSTYSSYSTTISLWLLMPNSTTNSTKWLQISRADFCSRHGTAWEPLAVSCWSHWTCVLLAFCLSRWFISDTTWFQGSWRVLSGLDRCTFRMHTTETLGTAAFRQGHILPQQPCHSVLWCLGVEASLQQPSNLGYRNRWGKELQMS